MKKLEHIQLVVLDLAGTTIDFGCQAPVKALIQAFAKKNITISAEHARRPMGLHKKEHLRAITEIPEIADQWQQMHGQPCSAEDIDEMYQQHYIPAQMQCIQENSTLIPGVMECAHALRSRGIKIATSTSYFRQAATKVFATMEQQGFPSEHHLCAEDVPQGHPAPWMIFHHMEALGVYPPATVVTVGDTIPDIEAGRNAAAWSVGVLHTSNEMGLIEQDFNFLDQQQRTQKVEAARRKLLSAGAHAVIPTAADLPDLISDLEARLQNGSHP